jgi:predicted HAD superfamily phosphohydrolase YqeG
MTPSAIVFLVDVDNTLLDNDRIQISPEVTR